MRPFKIHGDHHDDDLGRIIAQLFSLTKNAQDSKPKWQQQKFNGRKFCYFRQKWLDFRITCHDWSIIIGTSSSKGSTNCQLDKQQQQNMTQAIILSHRKQTYTRKCDCVIFARRRRPCGRTRRHDDDCMQSTNFSGNSYLNSLSLPMMINVS